jgi:F420H(2)-dependent quinone reductase
MTDPPNESGRRSEHGSRRDAPSGRPRPMISVIGRIGSHPAARWMIRHVVSPLDRLVVHLSGGRLPPPTGLFVPTLILTTIGRRSGTERATPVIYVRAGSCYVVGNARPRGERPNPWVLNLREMAETTIRVATESMRVTVEELGPDQAELQWPRLVAIWPALDDFFKATGKRAVFLLRPVERDPRDGEPSGELTS